MKTKLERYKETLENNLRLFELLRHAADSKNSADLADAGIVATEKALRPPPEMETVEETRYIVIRPDGTEVWCGKATPGITEGERIVKLTGTYLRAKPVPVERSVSTDIYWSIDGERVFPVNDKSFFDWKPLVGKKGIVTFTWQD